MVFYWPGKVGRAGGGQCATALLLAASGARTAAGSHGSWAGRGGTRGWWHVDGLMIMD